MKKRWLALLLLCPGWLYAQTVEKTMLRIPDSGQINTYTSTPGEDSDYTISPPGFLLHGNGTLTDTVTRLMWQQADGGEMRIEQARHYADTCTLAGYTDWRLPTPMESFSILNLQKVNPALDLVYFSNTGAEYWWTQLTQVNDTNKIWCTNAGGGIGNHPRTETLSAGGTKKFHVRLVRSADFQPVSSNRWTSTPDGFQVDFLTGLIWKSMPLPGLFNWEDALVAAESHSAGGYSDWRLPNIRELQSLHNPGRINPAIDQVFPMVAGEKYWSSTSLPNPNQSNKAWYWHNSFGITTYDLKTVANKVLLVRGPSTEPLAIQRKNNLAPLFRCKKTEAGWELEWEEYQNFAWKWFDLTGRTLAEGRVEGTRLRLHVNQTGWLQLAGAGTIFLPESNP